MPPDALCLGWWDDGNRPETEHHAMVFNGVLACLVAKWHLVYFGGHISFTRSSDPGDNNLQPQGAQFAIVI